MKKNKVERDLLEIFKSKDPEDLHYYIWKMVNGLYKYEYLYMRNIPYEEMLLYISKVISLVSKVNEVLVDVEYRIDVIEKFKENIGKFNKKTLNKVSLIGTKYDLLLIEEKLKRSLEGYGKVRAVSFLLALNMLLTLPSDTMAKEKEEETTEITYETPIEKPIFKGMHTYEPPVLENVVEEVTEVNEESGLDLENMTTEEKIDIILEEYNLTYEQFDVVVAIVLAEAAADSTKDAYAVINTIYNRTISKNFNIDIGRKFGEGTGRSLYYQAIAKNQFVVYQEGAYLKFLGVREGERFEAILEFLLTKEILHDYLYFLSNGTNVTREYEMFDDRGNKYFEPILEEDRIIEEEVEDQLSR